MQGTSFVVAPTIVHSFFQKAPFEGLFRNHLSEILCLTAQFLDLITVCSPRCVASQTLLPSFHEVIGPFVIDAL